MLHLVLINMSSVPLLRRWQPNVLTHKQTHASKIIHAYVFLFSEELLYSLPLACMLSITSSWIDAASSDRSKSSEMQGRMKEEGAQSTTWSPLLAICVNHSPSHSFTMRKDRMAESNKLVRWWQDVSKEPLTKTIQEKLVIVTTTSVKNFIYLQ